MSEHRSVRLDRETALGLRGLARQAIRSDEFETYAADLESLHELEEEIEADEEAGR